jgi:SnoaL-like domain
MDADQLARFERLLDRQDITDCLTRFCRGMDRFDRDLFLSAFHPSAEIAAGDFVGGPADLYEWAHNMHERGQIVTQHNLLNNTCDIDGDTAHSETYYLYAARNLDESNWIAGGRYFDRLERRDDQWRIMLRTNVSSGPEYCRQCRYRMPTCPTSESTAFQHGTEAIPPTRDPSSTVATPTTRSRLRDASAWMSAAPRLIKTLCPSTADARLPRVLRSLAGKGNRR